MAHEFSKNTKRSELEQFFAWCGEYEPYVRYLYLTNSRNQGEIETANELLKRVLGGEWIDIKCDAYEQGFIG